MRILSYQGGYVTNQEVYDVVSNRRENRLHKSGTAYAERNWIDHKVVQYCKRTGAAMDDKAAKATTSRLISSMAKFDFSKEEILQLINFRPKELVDLHTIIDECEDRFSDTELEELLQILSNQSTGEC